MKKVHNKIILSSCGAMLAAGMFLQAGISAEATEKVKRSEVML